MDAPGCLFQSLSEPELSFPHRRPQRICTRQQCTNPQTRFGRKNVAATCSVQPPGATGLKCAAYNCCPTSDDRDFRQLADRLHGPDTALWEAKGGLVCVSAPGQKVGPGRQSGNREDCSLVRPRA